MMHARTTEFDRANLLGYVIDKVIHDNKFGHIGNYEQQFKKYYNLGRSIGLQ